MLEEIDESIEAGKRFAFETTLSGLTYLKKSWNGKTVVTM